MRLTSSLAVLALVPLLGLPAGDSSDDRPWLIVSGGDEKLACTCVAKLTTMRNDPGQCATQAPTIEALRCVVWFGATVERTHGECAHDLDPFHIVCRPAPCEFGMSVSAFVDGNLCCCDRLPAIGGTGPGPWTSPGGSIYTPTPRNGMGPGPHTVQATESLRCDPATAGGGVGGSLVANALCFDGNPPTQIAEYTQFVECEKCK